MFRSLSSISHPAPRSHLHKTRPHKCDSKLCSTQALAFRVICLQHTAVLYSTNLTYPSAIALPFVTLYSCFLRSPAEATATKCQFCLHIDRVIGSRIVPAAVQILVFCCLLFVNKMSSGRRFPAPSAVKKEVTTKKSIEKEEEKPASTEQPEAEAAAVTVVVEETPKADSLDIPMVDAEKDPLMTEDNVDLSLPSPPSRTHRTAAANKVNTDTQHHYCY